MGALTFFGSQIEEVNITLKQRSRIGLNPEPHCRQAKVLKSFDMA
jgi:hypothetical protein